jgi:hypothetical protein
MKGAMGMSATILEYSYESESEHLDDAQAIDFFRKERARNPDALVVIDDRPCGHWDVETYNSKQEKTEYLQKRISQIYDKFLTTFRKR